MISFKEDHISQIPALLMLEKLGYTYLTPDEALALRGGNLANVLLEPVLRKQLAAINVVQVSSVRTTVFSEQNITAGIDALRNIPMDEGFMEASQTVYDLLTSGKTLEQIVDGDRKSFVMQYIDWKNPRNNVFHVTEEFAVSRTGMTDTYRPDIVLFVNGIPLCVIECKRPDVKDSIYSIVADIRRELEPDDITMVDKLALISVVGRNMSKRSGTSGKVFGALGEAGVNIRMITQSSQEISIILGVNNEDFDRAIQVIYDRFVRDEMVTAG